MIVMDSHKKSFLMYADYMHLVNKLDDETAGKLFKIILSFVNDEEVIINDILLEIAFEPIKQSLLRDSEKWNSIREKRSLSGRKGGVNSGISRKQNEANEANASNAKQNEANEAVSDSVNDSVSDSVNDSVNDSVSVSDNNINISDIINPQKPKKTKKNATDFDFKKSLIDYGINEMIAINYLKVRKEKKATNTEIAFKNLIKQIEASLPTFNKNECIEIAVLKSWAGFESEWVLKDVEKFKKLLNPKPDNMKSSDSTLRSTMKPDIFNSILESYGKKQK